MSATAHRPLFSLMRKLLRDRRGASAIEFAFVVPLMLVMYLGTLELGQGIETNKKVARAASMIGDLVTQDQETHRADLNAILKIGEAILQPYNRSEPTIEIIALRFDNAVPPRAIVQWSRKSVEGATSTGTPAGTEVSVPTSLRVPGSFLVKVETKLGYLPVVAWNIDSAKKLGYTSAFTGISMGESYYLRPRRSNEIPCSDC